MTDIYKLLADQLYPNGRGEAVERLNRMAGLDANGNIAPPRFIDDITPAGKAPVKWWKNRAADDDSSGLKTGS